MTSTVATDIPPAERPKTVLETWGHNERMRHIPTAAWLLEKFDGDLRRRIEVVCSSFERLPPAAPSRAGIEQALSSLCRSLERIADATKHARSAAMTGDIAHRVREALQHAVSSLRTLDQNLFGRRYPFQTHERSKAEPLFGSVLAGIDALHRAVQALREADPSLDERLLDGLVTLQPPLRPEPIA